MTAKFIILACLLLKTALLTAQQIIIADIDTKEPLPYAYITFFRLDKGLYADKDGVLALENSYQATDSLCAHMLGYHNVYTSIAALHDTLFLIPKTYNLSEITIRPLGEIIRLGDVKKYSKNKFARNLGASFSPRTIATIIKDEKRAGCYIESLLWRYHHQSAIHYVVRMQLYAVSSDGKPGKPLLQRSEPVTVDGQGLLSINVSSERIVFPAEGVFVGLEILEEINPYDTPIVNIRNLPYPWFFVRRIQTYISHPEHIYWHAVEFSEHKSLKVPFGLSVRCPK